MHTNMVAYNAAVYKIMYKMKYTLTKLLCCTQVKEGK